MCLIFKLYKQNIWMKIRDSQIDIVHGAFNVLLKFSLPLEEKVIIFVLGILETTNIRLYTA